jgi:hypothetical protein
MTTATQTPTRYRVGRITPSTGAEVELAHVFPTEHTAWTWIDGYIAALQACGWKNLSRGKNLLCFTLADPAGVEHRFVVNRMREGEENG